ncbi:TIGR02680 family protein [Nocardia sp. ET3-3]|uniref:TIGR02680 family protein n=1 Tax=Nocardia terrae TaxID=2675851 RepID=A0A7K1V721_9NOCA|nr:TIGR02680 family protein [Nocardia terrae]MVU82281.1 TIGR02680 family protein [Nocardia terrae]
MSIAESHFSAGDLDADTQRWTPIRAGIVNVWRYYDEIFEFHDGRLLLRGPNGSGKSKALELLLPFLFDASLRANRLSTFGTAERTMHWNLMGEGATGITRVGYVWLEFGMRGAPGRYFTCGARLQASTHTSTVTPDYFSTELRIIGETALSATGYISLTADGRPLTRSALEECLGDHGTVHPNAGMYRDAVRATLFPGMTGQRYDALITALLQLRTPKLSQRLDPALLSALLSKALPPMDQDEIADLAEGFERLDAQRERLTRLAQEVEATKVLARQQRTYAQRVLRSAAAALLSATSEVDKLSAAAKQSQDDYEQVQRDISTCEARLEAFAVEHDAAEARRETLMDSEAYREGQQLDRLLQQTEQARRRADELRGYARVGLSDARRAAERCTEATQEADRQRRVVDSRLADAAQASVRAGMSSVHGELVATADISRVRQLLRGAVQGRRTAIKALERALDIHDRAVDTRERAERELEAGRNAYTAADDHRSAAHRALTDAFDALREGLSNWASRCRQLNFTAVEELTDRVENEAAVLATINSAANAVFDEITRRESRCESDIEVARADRALLVAERDRLRNEEDILPTPPHWRTAERDPSAGAPLWQLVDFASAAAVSDRANIEAALEASGLLDAWIAADGTVVGHELFALPSALPSVNGRSLADVLIPLPNAVIGIDTVRRLLSAISFGESLPMGAVAIASDGSWRIGNLTGSWTKEQPAFVGALTRQRNRERRLSVIASQITSLDDLLAQLADRQRVLSERRSAVDAEVAARPRHDDAANAQFALTAAESDLRSVDRLVHDRIAHLDECEKAVRAALVELNGLAAEHGMPAERAAVDRMTSALEGFATVAETWLDDHHRWRSLVSVADERTEQRDRAEATAAQQDALASTAESDHRKLEAELAEAEAVAAGLGYQDVLARLRDLRSRLTELDGLLKAERLTQNQLSNRSGELKSKHEAHVRAHDETVAHRDELTHRFRHLATGTLAADTEMPDFPAFKATVDGSEGVRAARDAARLIAAAWPTIPYADNNVGDALNRLAASVHECRTTLAARADLDLETDGNTQILTAVIDGVRVGAAELLRILRTDADRARQEITDAEHGLFDRTLTGDTRRHLAARIRQANELVDSMNSRLAQVRTASHVSVRLVWEIAPDLPPGTRAARELLLKDPVRLTETDRESLHRFLRDRIEAAKAEDTATTWEQQLAQVFDYTSWHRFVVKVDRGKGDGWQLLTKKLHGALSGGEKAIALHLPLFAAVAAHYQTVPEAPRPILLDEVFVGVDTTNRGQIFALLSALDLDLMLTSDHEWCTYTELRGIGIHQLLTGDGDDAVTTARFTWDGEQLVSAE